MNPPPASTADVLLQLLKLRGVDQVFGIPGNHTVPLYRGFERSGIRHTTTRHEQGAAFMADGYARASGKPGVCILISGPGLLNAATAIAQARADSVPMLVISGVASLADLGMRHGKLHELPDQHSIAAGLCRESYTLLDPANLPELIDRAFACFTSARPGPVHIEIPLNLMDSPMIWDNDVVPTSVCAPAADPQAIQTATAMLSRATNPLILVGGGAINAAAGVVALAERLQAPVLNTVNGKGICPANHPLAVGGSPSLGCLRSALSDADVVLAIGTEIGETDYDLLMVGGQLATNHWIRIDIDPQQLLIPSPPALAIVANARLATDQLLAQLKPNETAAGSSTGVDTARALRAQVASEPHFHPEMAAFFATLQQAAPDAVLVGDSTRPTYYAAWQYECNAPRSYFHSASGFGTLGYALPAAFGAKMAGTRPVICLIGDGAMQFTLTELTTGAEACLGVPVIVWNNEGYGEIENSMHAQGVAVDSTRILTPDFAASAQAHHCAYAQPENLPELAEALSAALAHPVPTLIEVRERDFLTQPSGQWYQ